MKLDCFTYEELEEELVGRGMPRFRAEQVYRWLGKGVRSFEEMKNLPKQLREELAEHYSLTQLSIHRRFRSKLDDTTKYLILLEDGHLVECVAMYYHHGITLCLSTQVGCRMGCRFCASTLGGKERNLTAAELLGQVQLVQQDLGERISNLVLMGIGEPFDNYDEVLTFLRNVNHPMGLQIGFRHISLSTCGLVDRIDRFAKEGIPLTLSVSLHAPNNELRNRLMPVNARYPVEQLIASCRRYEKITGRRITFEYILIEELNDTAACAKQLAELIRGMGAHVNLIPANFVEECGFRPSSPERVKAFSKQLAALGVNATVRRELGSDIAASCGQLRKDEINANMGSHQSGNGEEQ